MPSSAVAACEVQDSCYPCERFSWDDSRRASGDASDDWSFPATIPTHPLTPVSFRNARNWPCFRHFRVSPFRGDSCLKGQPCAPAPFAGGRFLPVSGFNQELVNGAARVVRPQAGRAETGPRISLTSTAEHRADPIHQTAPSSNSPPTANSFLPAALASATAWLATKGRQQTVRLGPA